MLKLDTIQCTKEESWNKFFFGLRLKNLNILLILILFFFLLEVLLFSFLHLLFLLLLFFNLKRKKEKKEKAHFVICINFLLWRFQIASIHLKDYTFKFYCLRKLGEKVSKLAF